MIVCKMIQFARLKAINEITRYGKRTNFKELPRPYKLLQGAPTKSVKGREKIDKTCLPQLAFRASTKS